MVNRDFMEPKLEKLQVYRMLPYNPRALPTPPAKNPETLTPIKQVPIRGVIFQVPVGTTDRIMEGYNEELEEIKAKLAEQGITGRLCIKRVYPGPGGGRYGRQLILTRIKNGSISTERLGFKKIAEFDL